MRYKKNGSAALDAAFASAEPFGRIRLAPEAVFYRRGFGWHYVPLTDVVRAYRRVQQVEASTACCTNDFSIHHLILLTAGGERHELLIGEALYRHEPERLLEALSAQHPSITIGKLPEGAAS